MEVLKPGDIAFDPSITPVADPAAAGAVIDAKPFGRHQLLLEELQYLGQNATPLPHNFFLHKQHAQDPRFSTTILSLDVEKSPETYTWLGAMLHFTYPESHLPESASAIRVQVTDVPIDMFCAIVSGLYGLDFPKPKKNLTPTEIFNQFPETIPFQSIDERFIPLVDSPVYPLFAVPVAHRALLAGALKEKPFSKDRLEKRVKHLTNPYLTTKDVMTYAAKTNRVALAPDALRAYCAVFLEGS